MDIIVSNMDSTPIYEQITRQIKAKILGGELQPGEALPSMLLVSGGVCGLRVMWILALLPFFHDIRVVLVSYPLSWSLTSLLFLAYYLRGNWLRRQCRRMGFVPPQPHPEG